MALFHNNVLDAALDHISSNGVELEVQDASNSVLIDAVTLDANNYGSNADNSGSSGGRKLECLQSHSSDMASISVSTGGSADHVAIKDASGNVLVTASISSAPVTLGSADKLTIGTFEVILKDPS